MFINNYIFKKKIILSKIKTGVCFRYNNEIFIKNENPSFGKTFTYQIADLTGRIVSTGNLTNSTMSNKIDITNLAPSVYILSISENGKYAKQIRFVKSKV